MAEKILRKRQFPQVYCIGCIGRATADIVTQAHDRKLCGNVVKLRQQENPEKNSLHSNHEFITVLFRQHVFLIKKRNLIAIERLDDMDYRQ